MRRVIVLISALAAALVFQVVPAFAQQESGSLDQYSESPGSKPATVTFELTVEGEVPEGKLLGVSMGIADAPEPVFCSTGNFHTDLPRCEAGSTYTDTSELFYEGDTLSYEYYVMDYDYGGIVETFAADEITVSDGQTISATYQADNPEGKEVTLTGVVEKPEGTTYQYGTHGISDWDSGYYALRSDTVDLDAYVGQKVNVYGTLVPGYENAQVEGGPPLVEVTRVEPTEEPGTESVTLSFELAVQGQPPTETDFFGYVPAEGGIATQLTDPDGDGLYTGCMDVPQYAPGPRPVPEGIDPVTLPVQIVMSSEAKYGVPLYPDLVEDFGQVLMDEDKTFSASIVFENPGPVEPGPTTPEPATPEPTTSEPTTSEPTTSEPTTSEPTTPNTGDDSPTIPEGLDVLPDTGGFTLAVLGMIAFLTTAGLLFAGLLYTGLLRRR